jgi:hypothetical protein
MEINKIIVFANSEDEAREKAIEKYIEIKNNMVNVVDAGSPRADFVELME